MRDAFFDFSFYRRRLRRVLFLLWRYRFFDAFRAVDGGMLQFYAEFFADHLCAGDEGNVFEDRFTAVAEARSFYGAYF